MENTILAFLLEEINYQGVMASIVLQPETIVILVDTNKDLEDVKFSVKSILENNCINTNMLLKSFRGDDLKMAQSFMEKELQSINCISVTESIDACSFIFMETAKRFGVMSVFVDGENNKIIYSKDGIIEIMDKTLETNIESIMALSGAGVIRQENSFYEMESVKLVLEFLTQSYQIWTNAIQVIKRKASSVPFSPNPLFVRMDMANLDIKHSSDFMTFLKYLEGKSQIERVSTNNQQITFYFKDLSLKNFIFKTGSWLEALVYKAVSELKQVDDIKCGVVFYWERSEGSPVNEIDVMASVDSRLVLISCKDTYELETAYLNELEVYGDMLGGENTKKIIVLSNRHDNEKFIRRAEEMDIDVLYFNGNYERFKEILKRSIEFLR